MRINRASVNLLNIIFIHKFALGFESEASNFILR